METARPIATRIARNHTAAQCNSHRPNPGKGHPRTKAGASPHVPLIHNLPVASCLFLAVKGTSEIAVFMLGVRALYMALS